MRIRKKTAASACATPVSRYPSRKKKTAAPEVADAIPADHAVAPPRVAVQQQDRDEHEAEGDFHRYEDREYAAVGHERVGVSRRPGTGSARAVN